MNIMLTTAPRSTPEDPGRYGCGARWFLRHQTAHNKDRLQLFADPEPVFTLVNVRWSIQYKPLTDDEYRRMLTEFVSINR